MLPHVKCAQKITLLTVGFTFLFTIIVARLFDLQIRHGKQLVELSQKNFLRSEKVQPTRGNILDANGNLLATNRPVIKLFWHGLGTPKMLESQTNSIRLLEQILGTELLTSHSLQRAERFGRRVELADDLSMETVSRIVEQLPAHSQIHITSGVKRFYPHMEMASHLLGYLGQGLEVDNALHGKSGFEKMLEDSLRGEEGEIQKIINSIGKSIAERELKQANAGTDIKTTLDFNLQNLAEQSFPKTNNGCMLIMDPHTGALRALVSRPNFDPNIFLDAIDQDMWQDLQGKKAFLNRAFNAAYPPASIFKLITVAAALEQGIISQEAMVNCCGYYQFGNYRHWCMQHTGHGKLTVKQAVAKSCNILFYHIGKHMHVDTLADYAQRFGLGQKVDMLFPNLPGLVPNSSWKKEVKKERWWPGETLSFAIGQSFTLVTPIQIARMVASIFTGKLVSPRLLEDDLIEQTPLNIKPSTLEFIRDSMRSVVKIGTGARTGNIEGIEVFAKTGTAQVSSLALREKDTKDNRYKEHGWFVAYFKQAGKEPFVMVILMEHVETSIAAAQVAKNFLIGYREL